MNTYGKLFWTFFRIGGLTFGGGLAMLPMLEHELVDKSGWLTTDELLDCYGIGQCTPGIIAVNTATFVGYKQKGVLGGIAATLGMVAPSVMIITAVAAFLRNYMDNKWFQHALMGIRGVVCALMINTVINLAQKSLVDIFSYVVCAAVLAASFFTNIPLILPVLLSAAAGIIINVKTGSKEKSCKNSGKERI